MHLGLLRSVEWMLDRIRELETECQSFVAEIARLEEALRLCEESPYA